MDTPNKMCKGSELGIQMLINLGDVFRTLGSGCRVVHYAGHYKNMTYVLDWFGNRIKIPDSKFELINIMGFETKVDWETGETEILVADRWANLGPMFGDCPPLWAKGIKKKKTKIKQKPKKKSSFYGSIF
jgi:hypothetical protein